jgi:hypothetical protein
MAKPRNLFLRHAGQIKRHRDDVLGRAQRTLRKRVASGFEIVAPKVA